MRFIPCQLAAGAKTLPTGSTWVFEPKLDGYRGQLHLTKQGPILYTRGGLDWTDRLRTAVPRMTPPHLFGSVIDGEVCALDKDRRPDFALLGRSLATGQARLYFFAFDLLIDRGDHITALPLLARKARLRRLLEQLGAAHIPFVEHTDDGDARLEQLRTARWEGVMAKDAEAPYMPGIRAPTWRKIKFRNRQEFVVAGWSADATTGGVKSIVLATIEHGKVVLRGSVGSGFSRDERLRLARQFQAAEPGGSVTDAARLAVSWLGPEFVAEIEFQELAPSGCVRGARFLGLREDKTAAAVMLEAARAA